jgi:hypothetical protein
MEMESMAKNKWIESLRRRCYSGIDCGLCLCEGGWDKGRDGSDSNRRYSQSGKSKHGRPQGNVEQNEVEAQQSLSCDQDLV